METVGSGNRREDSIKSLGMLSNNVISEIKTAQSLQPKQTTSKIPKAKRLGTQSLIKVSKLSN